MAPYQMFSRNRGISELRLCTHCILGRTGRKTQEVGQTSSTLMETMLRRNDELVMLQLIYERVADSPFHYLSEYN